jgi:hypothetical protein
MRALGGLRVPRLPNPSATGIAVSTTMPAPVITLPDAISAG